MTAPSIADPATLLGEDLAEASPDLLRHLMTDRKKRTKAATDPVTHLPVVHEILARYQQERPVDALTTVSGQIEAHHRAG